MRFISLSILLYRLVQQALLDWVAFTRAQVGLPEAERSSWGERERWRVREIEKVHNVIFKQRTLVEDVGTTPLHRAFRCYSYWPHYSEIHSMGIPLTLLIWYCFMLGWAALLWGGRQGFILFVCLFDYLFIHLWQQWLFGKESDRKVNDSDWLNVNWWPWRT